MITRLSFHKFFLSLAGLSAVSVGFFVFGAFANHSLEFWYLLWNLFLAWVPLGLALWLELMLRHKIWSSWQGIILSILWLGFLPNSFYMVSDYIHLQDVQRLDILYDSVMFTSFILSGLAVGCTSLYLIHRQFLRRLSGRAVWGVIGGILLICSFAIYLGRDLRWNTWDVLLNPAGILFDVSDRVIHPAVHPAVLTTTLTFFVLLSSVYFVVWQLLQALRPSGNR